VPLADATYLVAAFRQGLKEAGFIEGQNVAIEQRYAAGAYDRMSGLAIDLVRLNAERTDCPLRPEAMDLAASEPDVQFTFIYRLVP
jgi:hypothetical protein